MNICICLCIANWTNSSDTNWKCTRSVSWALMFYSRRDVHLPVFLVITDKLFITTPEYRSLGRYVGITNSRYYFRDIVHL